MKNPYAEAARRWDEAAARRLGNTPSPQVPKPSPLVDERAATAKMIVRAGQWRRGERASPEEGEPGRSIYAAKREAAPPAKTIQPGDIVLRVVEQQRREREGR